MRNKETAGSNKKKTQDEFGANQKDKATSASELVVQ